MNILLEEGCLGCGSCADICPEIFELDETGYSRVHTQIKKMNEELMKRFDKVMENCPILAIALEDEPDE